MRHWQVLTALFALGAATPIHAQSLVGQWQGMAGPQQIVLNVSEGRTGTLQGEFYFLGFDASNNPISSIELVPHCWTAWQRS